MVLPHLFFTVNFSNHSRGCAWVQGSFSHPQPELLLLLPSSGHCSDSLQGGTFAIPAQRGPEPQLRAQSLPLVQELAAMQGPQQPLGSWLG